MIARPGTLSEQARSRYDQNRPAAALASQALNVRVTRERLPQADYLTRVATRIPAYVPVVTPQDRAAQRERLAAARATFRTVRVR